MSKPLIEYITCDSGDWHVLRVNFGEDFNYEGHSIPDDVWIKLFEEFGFTINKKYLSDEDMEEGNY